MDACFLKRIWRFLSCGDFGSFGGVPLRAHFVFNPAVITFKSCSCALLLKNIYLFVFLNVVPHVQAIEKTVKAKGYKLVKILVFVAENALFLFEREWCMWKHSIPDSYLIGAISAILHFCSAVC